jgi:hypothetical protein
MQEVSDSRIEQELNVAFDELRSQQTIFAGIEKWESKVLVWRLLSNSFRQMIGLNRMRRAAQDEAEMRQ